MTTAEVPSAFQQDMLKNNEGAFRSTLETIAAHSAGIAAADASNAETGAVRTDLLFVLEEGHYTPDTLKEMEITLGLDSSATAVITAEGSAVIVQAGISAGRVAEIFEDGAKNPRLQEALDGLKAEATEHARKVSLDSLADVKATIRASVGQTYAGQPAEA